MNAFINSYLEIIYKRKDLKFSERQKEFQRFRRGRYVEFNLIYDRGTLFGLQSGGRIESILMSLPNEVSWRYKFDEQLTDEEKKLYMAIKKSKMGMKYKLGIVGKDIAYSLSPYIHLSFGKEADIQLTYDIFDLDASPLEFIEKFFEEGGTGLNITKPFKEIVAERYSPLGDVSVNTLSLETKADLNNNTVIKAPQLMEQAFLKT